MPSPWFRRFADIPGVAYEPPVSIDRTKLDRHDTTPELRRFELDGRVTEEWNWDFEYEEDGELVTASRSPASEIAFDADHGPLATSTLLQRLWEGLELPGEPSDYHFAIQSWRASWRSVLGPIQGCWTKWNSSTGSTSS